MQTDASRSIARREEVSTNQLRLALHATKQLRAKSLFKPVGRMCLAAQKVAVSSRDFALGNSAKPRPKSQGLYTAVVPSGLSVNEDESFQNKLFKDLYRKIDRYI